MVGFNGKDEEEELLVVAGGGIPAGVSDTLAVVWA
jgi:hypothetical protein